MRRPIEEFTLAGARDQAEVRRRLLATQSLICDSAASLVYRRDVIIFAAHEILGNDGKLHSYFPDCAFRVSTRAVDGEVHVEDYPILVETLDYGPLVEKGADDGDPWLQSNADDWAVARLARPVIGIEPYPLIPQGDIGRLTAIETPLVMVSPPPSNWHGKTSYLAQSCRSLTFYSDTTARFPALLFTDCFSGFGASGGAVLADDGHGGLGYLATAVAAERKCTKGETTTCESTSRLLDADLIARIKGTTGLQDGTQDAPYRVAQAQRLAAARAATTEAIARELDAPMKVTDEASRKAAELYASMRRLSPNGHFADFGAVVTAATQALGNDFEDRPEMAYIALSAGDTFRARGRMSDAKDAYYEANLSADVVLAGYVALRMGEIEDDPKSRRVHLMEAYRLGGRTLFERFGSVAEVPDLGAQ